MSFHTVETELSSHQASLGFEVKRLPNGLRTQSRLSMASVSTCTPVRATCPPSPIQHASSTSTDSTYTATAPARESNKEEGSSWGANFWCVVQDPGGGERFFANPDTGECRWTLPQGSMVLPPSDDGQWWQLTDAQSGCSYYFHTRTHATQWTRPDAQLVIPMTAVQLKLNQCTQSSGRVRRVHSLPRKAAVVERARDSIVSRDQTALAQARGSPSLRSDAPQRRKPRTAPTPTRPPRIESNTLAAAPTVAIRRVGKGLAHDAGHAPLRARRSMPVLKPRRAVTHLPPDLAHALTVPTRTPQQHPKPVSVPAPAPLPIEPKTEAKLPRSRSFPLRWFSRCKRPPLPD
ncbi:hypothetical protein PANT_16d00051 [Moesziomyces antarcticus T-34]|uniref:WW domain-containing protein n=1 Tax=Pseudozyma antarctica (strain T-34) TaxID=1151754 RepID=M9MET9_PSEA3|nr:hypothetical protein PANT_16d00051 [Moesziomyces antarcticus T-34]